MSHSPCEPRISSTTQLRRCSQTTAGSRRNCFTTRRWLSVRSPTKQTTTSQPEKTTTKNPSNPNKKCEVDPLACVVGKQGNHPFKSQEEKIAGCLLYWYLGFKTTQGHDPFPLGNYPMFKGTWKLQVPVVVGYKSKVPQ